MKTRFTILGCGSSFGVPRIDGFFGNCDPNNKKNYRTRCSVLISSKNHNILIDTSPDIKKQFIDNKVKNIDKVFYTHMHADQTHGINELRVFYLKNRKQIPIYADILTSKYLKKSFNYCFQGTKTYPAILKINQLKKKYIFNNRGQKISIRSVKVNHGSIKSNAYIINDTCGYAPDVNQIFLKDYKYFKNLKFLVIDCLRYKPHPTHFNLDDVIRFINVVKPKYSILTNLNNEIDYKKIKKKLPKNITPAFDGMSFLI